MRALTGWDEATLVAHLKALVAAQLLVEESADRFAFRLALTREAIYAQLLARERRALHRTIGEAIERSSPDVAARRATDLALHFYEGAVWEKALAYARRVGEDALALYAPRAAAEHFTHALAAADRLAQEPAFALYRARAQAYETLGEFEAARADYERAIAAVRRAADGRAEWQGLIELGFLWLGHDYGKAGAHLREALNLARRLGDRSLLAQSLNRLGNWLANAGKPREARRYHEEALTIYRERDDPRGIAETIDLLALAAQYTGELPRAVALFEEASARFHALDDRRGLVSSLVTWAANSRNLHVADTLALPHASAEPAVRACTEGLAIARAIGWRPAEALGLSLLANCRASGGDLGAALAAAREGLAIAEEIGHRQWMANTNQMLGSIYLDLRVLPEARRRLERAHALARETNTRAWIDWSAAVLARACILDRDLDSAATLLEGTFPSGEPETIMQRQLLAARGELALTRGEPAKALSIADILIAAAEAARAQDARTLLWPALVSLGRLHQRLRRASAAAAATSARISIGATRAARCSAPGS